MRETLASAKNHSVCVRLLDTGADKPLPFLGFMAESNPALGRRGIRLLLEYTDLLRTQIEALLELSQEFEVRILIPMVTVPADISSVKSLIQRIGSERKRSRLPALGAMIETPAAALSAKSLSKHADFLSFGTNDLTQYAFAADRDNAAVEQYFDDTSDAIFRFVQITHDDVPEMPLSMCGELAGKPDYVSRLLRVGIRSLSVAPQLVPQVKQAVRDAYCLNLS